MRAIDAAGPSGALHLQFQANFRYSRKDGRNIGHPNPPFSQEEFSMAETVKKTSSTKAPAKPRKAAARKGTAENGAPVNGVTEIKFSHEQVAQLAHRYWNERGRQDGHHLEDWYRAEHELRSRAS